MNHWQIWNIMSCVHNMVANMAGKIHSRLYSCFREWYHFICRFLLYFYAVRYGAALFQQDHLLFVLIRAVIPTWIRLEYATNGWRVSHLVSYCGTIALFSAEFALSCNGYLWVHIQTLFLLLLLFASYYRHHVLFTSSSFLSNGASFLLIMSAFVWSIGYLDAKDMYSFRTPSYLYLVYTS